jgi:hypothetical protein
MVLLKTMMVTGRPGAHGPGLLGSENRKEARFLVRRGIVNEQHPLSDLLLNVERSGQCLVSWGP